jgi:hypothetical protein
MLQVREWRAEPGRDLPEPVLADDRGAYPAEVVTQILAFVESRREELAAKGPTPQVIALGRALPLRGARFAGTDKPPEKVGIGVQVTEWEYGTFEVILRDRRTKAALAYYHYAGAREVTRNHVIVGPRLEVRRIAQV